MGFDLLGIVGQRYGFHFRYRVNLLGSPCRHLPLLPHHWQAMTKEWHSNLVSTRILTSMGQPKILISSHSVHTDWHSDKWTHYKVPEFWYCPMVTVPWSSKCVYRFWSANVTKIRNEDCRNGRKGKGNLITVPGQKYLDRPRGKKRKIGEVDW